MSLLHGLANQAMDIEGCSPATSAAPDPPNLPPNSMLLPSAASSTSRPIGINGASFDAYPTVPEDEDGAYLFSSSAPGADGTNRNSRSEHTPPGARAQRLTGGV